MARNQVNENEMTQADKAPATVAPPMAGDGLAPPPVGTDNTIVPSSPERERKEALEIEVAEAEAEASGQPMGSEAQQKAAQRVVRKRSELQRARKESVNKNPDMFLDPQQRAVANQSTPRGAIWSGSANYSSGESPHVIRTPDGQMWYQAGGYVSNIKDDRELNTIVSLDTQMFTAQQRQMTNAAKEALLDSKANLNAQEANTFRFLNQKMVGLRMEGHRANLSEDQLALLMPLYEDAALLEYIYSNMNSEEAAAFLTDMEGILLAGGDPSQIGVAVENSAKAANDKRAANVVSQIDGLDQLIKEDKTQMRALEDQINEYNQQLADPMFTELAEEGVIASTTAMRDAAAADQDRIRDLIRRRQNKRSYIQGQEIARAPGPQDNDLDANALESGSNLNYVDTTMANGTLYTIMDLVARDNGYDGIGGLHHESLASAISSPDGVKLGKFISECQRKARQLGWNTSDDSTDMWVKSALAHIVQTQNVDQISALVDAVNRGSTVDQDFPERKVEDPASRQVSIPALISRFRDYSPPPVLQEENMEWWEKLVDDLVSAGVPREKAKVIAKKVNDSELTIEQVIPQVLQGQDN